MIDVGRNMLLSAIGLVVLFWVMTMAIAYDVGLIRGKNQVRMGACFSSCDVKAYDLEPEEYIECLEQCEEWRCNDG